MKKIATNKKRDTENSTSKNKKTDSNQQAKKEHGMVGNPNTGPIFYFSNAHVKVECVKEENAIKKYCDEEKEKSRDTTKKSKANNAKLGKISDKIQNDLESIESAIKKGYTYKRTDNNSWIEDHCHALWIKPQAVADQFDKFKEKLEDFEKKLNQEISDVLMQAGGKAVDMAKDKMIDYGKKAVVREGAALVSLTIPVVGEIIVAGATIWNFVDGVWSAGKVAVDALKIGEQALEKYKELAPQLKKIENLLNGKLTPSTVLADMMTVLATTNPCIQARRCSLVRFDETEGKNGHSSGKIQADSGKGCCPGQTGHHVLPGAMFDLPDNPCGKKYKHSEAPVICLEGTNNNVGSHGVAHTALEKIIEKYKLIKKTEKISYKDASKHGIQAIRIVNPLCSEECLQAQLDKHYKDNLECGDDAQLKANPGKADKKPKEVKKDTSEIDNN